MIKGLGVSVAVSLLVASVSLADILQGQGLGIGGLNTAALVDGPGVADSMNLTTATQLQRSTGMGGLMQAVNFQTGTLGQAAGVGGSGGGIGIDQNGSALMTQGQEFVSGLGIQDQAAGIVLGDALTKLGGSGSGVGMGIQAFMGAQYQVIAGPSGISVNVNIPAVSTLQIAHY
jgi:hypothetical protein